MVLLMWLFTTSGFLSIVQHKDLPGFFQVKSRSADPLEALWPDQEVEVIDWADYRFRITARKEKVIPVITATLESLDYTSFKNECSDDEEYHRALTRIWGTMFQFQDLLERRSGASR